MLIWHFKHFGFYPSLKCFLFKKRKEQNSVAVRTFITKREETGLERPTGLPSPPQGTRLQPTEPSGSRTRRPWMAAPTAFQGSSPGHQARCATPAPFPGAQVVRGPGRGESAQEERGPGWACPSPCRDLHRRVPLGGQPCLRAVPGRRPHACALDGSAGYPGEAESGSQHPRQ